MVQTTLLGFCSACQCAHIREHIGYDKELKAHYCKRTGRDFRQEFYPPIPVETTQSVIDDPEYNPDGYHDENEDNPGKIPDIITIIPSMLEDVVSTAGIDPEKYKEEISTWVEQIRQWMKTI